MAEFSADITAELSKLSKRIFEITGREFNIGSPKQVGEVFGELNIATGRKTATGQVSTSHDVLVDLDVAVVAGRGVAVRARDPRAGGDSTAREDGGEAGRHPATLRCELLHGALPGAPPVPPKGGTRCALTVTMEGLYQ